jgi:predicted TIM-barrel fold metal-dependent hydrolase
VLVSPSFEGTRNDVVCAAAQAEPARFSVMARFDPTLPEARNFLPQCRALPSVRGVRLSFHRPSLRALLMGDSLDWLWQQAEALGIPLMVLAQHADFPRIGEIAARHPQLRIALDHLGLTEGRDAEAFHDFDQLLALAKYPNLSAKASCVPLFTADAYPFRRIHPYLRSVYDAFGAQRMFWGSDLSRLPCSYRQGVTLFTEELDWLHGSELESVMGRALCAWLGWP